MPEIIPNFNLQDDYTANWAITHAMELVPKASLRIAAAFTQLTAEWVRSGEGLEGFTLRIMAHRFGEHVRYTRPKAERAALHLSTKVFA